MLKSLLISALTASIVLTGCNSGSANPTPSATSETTTTASVTPSGQTISLMQPGLGEGVFILPNFLVKFPVYGVQIIALAQNNTDKLITAPEYVSADFLDASGQKIGSAFGMLNNVPARSVKIFLMAGTDRVANYSKVNFQIGQIIDGNPDQAKIKIGTPTVFNNISGAHVRVTIENLSGSSKSVVLIAGFFDANKKIVGSATGGRLNLAPGTHELTLDSEETISNYKYIQVQLDSLL